MTDPRKHPAYARAAAIKRLIQQHQEEFDKLYREEADQLGVRPRRLTRQMSGRTDIVRVLDEMYKL